MKEQKAMHRNQTNLFFFNKILTTIC